MQPELAAQLDIVLKRFSKRTQYILRHTFGIGVTKLTQKEIAKQVGPSQVTIWRIRNQALDDLRRDSNLPQEVMDWLEAVEDERRRKRIRQVGEDE